MWQQWGPGTCKYGSRCSFAHGEHELRSPHLRRGGNAPGDSTSTAVPPGLGQGQDLPQQEGMPQDKDEDGVDGSVDSSDAGPSTSAGIPKRRKTRLCTQFMQTGACEYGEACKFAHGEHEFQKINKQAKGLSGDGAKGGAGGNSKKFKTRLCLKFQQFGQCSYGNSCSFAHGIEELAWKDPWARTAMMHMSGSVLPFPHRFRVEPLAFHPLPAMPTVCLCETERQCKNTFECLSSRAPSPSKVGTFSPGLSRR